MPISFGRKNFLAEKKATNPTVIVNTAFFAGNSCLASETHSSLVDLRAPELFREAFIPGSYNVPDLSCVVAARAAGLFRGRKIYLLADHEEQLQLCSQSGDLGDGTDLAGWFSPDAIDEWKKTKTEIGTIEAISSDTLAIRMAACNTLLFDIYTAGEESRPSHPEALGFQLDKLPLSVEGLPLTTSICLSARSVGVASFAASLLWNFGFRKASYLASGRLLMPPIIAR